MCFYMISVAHIRQIEYCLKGFTLFTHIPHRDGTHMPLEINKKKREKISMPKAKTKPKITKG